MVNHGWECHPLNVIMPLLTDLGLGQVQVSIIAILAVAIGFWHIRGQPGESSRLRKAWRDQSYWSAPLLWSFVVSGIMAQVLKIIPRQRPWWYYLKHNPHVYVHVLGEHLRVRGFPSGHESTSIAIALIACLVLKGKRERWIARMLLIVAIGVGLSRLYVGAHWPLDVLGGIGVGLASTGIVYWAIIRKRTSGSVLVKATEGKTQRI